MENAAHYFILSQQTPKGDSYMRSSVGKAVRSVLLVALGFWTSSCSTSPASHSSTGSAAQVPTQLAKDLIGTWVLVGEPGNADEIAGSRLKFLTGRYWTITEADPTTGLTIYHHGGTYTLEGDKYTETVEYANPSTSNLINQSFQFAIKIDGDTLTQTGIGNPWTEKWKRAVPKGAVATAMKPKVLTVTVMNSDGRPLTNVTVVCVGPDAHAILNGTVLDGGDERLQTDSKGQFSIPLGSPDLVLVSTDKGFSLSHSWDLAKKPTMILLPWGRIEGVLVNRNRPVSNQRLMLMLDWRCLGGNIFDRLWTTNEVTTDSQGRFTFEPAPPMGLCLSGIERSTNIWYDLGHFEVQPGQISNLRLATNGRIVSGRVEATPDLPRNLDLNSCEIWLKPVSARQRVIPALPKEVDTIEKRTTWWEDWYRSDAGQIVFPPLDKRGSPLTVQSNGDFMSEIVVAPGRYWINGSLIQNRKKVGKIDQYVDIAWGDDSDTPYDLGKIMLKPALQAGDLAPGINTKTLDDKPLKLSNFRGKYVLLDFWATWCGPCRAEMPNLKNVYESFGNDRHFAMISLSLDSEPSQPKGYIEANKVGWEQVFLGDWNLDSVTKAFEVDSIPSIWLIGPDGKIIARGLRGSKIKETVAAALGNAERE
jgi:thiol-disulfide isomerase/thioredoxin